LFRISIFVLFEFRLAGVSRKTSVTWETTARENDDREGIGKGLFLNIWYHFMLTALQTLSRGKFQGNLVTLSGQLRIINYLHW